MAIQILEVFNPYVLLAIGVALIALETFITSFIIIWFGIGFVITAGISLIYDFNDGLWQLASVSLISLLLIILLRKKFLEAFLNSSKDINDNFLDEKGIGEIKNSKIFYKGTYWEFDESIDEKEFEEGEKVIVLKTHKNFALIEKK